MQYTTNTELLQKLITKNCLPPFQLLTSLLVLSKRSAPEEENREQKIFKKKMSMMGFWVN